MNAEVYYARRDKVLRDFVGEALKSRYWIYQSDNKQWYTPEEFLEKYSRRDIQTSDGWLEKFKIMNPLKGLAAADIIIKQIDEKRSSFQQRIIEYYQNK